MAALRIALVISRSPVGEMQHNLDAVHGWVRRAGEQQADIICFPELNLSGYSNHPDIVQSAETVPGPASRQLLQMAAVENMVILAGLAERGQNGRLFASHLVAHPDGALGIYRKLYISPPERAIYQAGDDVALFTTKGFKFGIQLCYDAHFPELTTHMAEQGADLIFVPHASPRGTAARKHTSWMRHLPARAYDNSLYVAACNQVGENGKGLKFPGNGVVFNPSGEIMATSLEGRESLFTADLRREQLAWVRNHEMRYFFPNRRPELYRSQ